MSYRKVRGFVFINQEFDEFIDERIFDITQNMFEEVLWPLFLARSIKYKNLEYIKDIIEGMDINTECIGGMTPLVYSVRNYCLNKKC